jgi:hypothetical protein
VLLGLLIIGEASRGLSGNSQKSEASTAEGNWGLIIVNHKQASKVNE